MRRPLTLLVLLCLVLVATVSAAAAPANRVEDCTWGASSMVVEEINGQFSQSEPAMTGCMP
jgi:hypothetical protein